MGKQVTLDKPILKFQDHISGYFVTKADSGSVKLTPRWFTHSFGISCILACVILFVGVWMPMFGLGFPFSYAFLGQVTIILVVSIMLVGCSLEHFERKAVKQLLSKSNRAILDSRSKQYAETYSVLRKIPRDNPGRLCLDGVDALPSKEDMETFTFVVRHGNTVHYTHFHCVPEEKAWLEKFNLAMELG